MIARQDQYVGRHFAANDVDVLVYRIGCALVPVVGITLRSGQNLHALAQLLLEVAPAAHQVLDQRVRLVLGYNADATDT